MPLKIELKPNERIIVGEALITNDNERTRLYIEGNAPILREKFIMRESEANTPSRRIYFVVQQMYLSKTPIDLHDVYFRLVRDLQTAAPSMLPYLMKVNESILAGNYYDAIKHADSLVKREDDVFGEQLKVTNQTFPTEDDMGNMAIADGDSELAAAPSRRKKRRKRQIGTELDDI